MKSTKTKQLRLLLNKAEHKIYDSVMHPAINGGTNFQFISK